MFQLEAVFYIPYILLQVPSNMLLTRVRPRYLIAGLTMGWVCKFFFPVTTITTGYVDVLVSTQLTQTTKCPS